MYNAATASPVIIYVLNRRHTLIRYAITLNYSHKTLKGRYLLYT